MYRKSFSAKLFLWLFLGLAFTSFTAIGQEIIYYEDFESGQGLWYADNGVWEIGLPSSGPKSGHSGKTCAATILAGDYPNNANTRLVSPRINLPSLSANEKLRLRFWHWFWIDNNYEDYDYGCIQLSKNNGAWQTISGNFDEYSSIWSKAYIDLSDYANSSIRIAFYFRSSDSETASGWYIDDIEIVKGPVTFHNPESFELDIGDWSSDNGLWEIGKPSVGRANCHSGQNCAGTVLNGNYFNCANTRLISPEVTLQSLSANEKLRLRFWQWFWIDNNYEDYDYGVVQISVNGGEWQTISGAFDEYSAVWSQVYIDISKYTNMTVRFAFYFLSSDSEVSSGWYIDDVEIVNGPVVFNNPENFESGIGDWSVDNGLWEIGKPSVGPANCHSGQNCAATVLNANYFNCANTRLISPEITLSPKFGEVPELYFWHWFRMDNNYEDYDYGIFQISVNGGAWKTISGYYDEYSTIWSQAMVSLAAYANSTVRLAFYFESSDSEVDNGWFIDDIRIEGIVTTAIYDSEDEILLSKMFALHQNYPNPFNPSTTIEFSIPRSSQVTLKIYDVLGKEVSTLVDEELPVGLHRVNWNAQHLASGVYIYKIQAGEFVQTMKMILMR